LNKDKFARLGELVEMCVHLLTVPLLLLYTILVLLPLTLMLVITVGLINLDFSRTWEYYVEDSGLIDMLVPSFYINAEKQLSIDIQKRIKKLC